MSGTTTLDMLSARQVNVAEVTGLQATLPGLSGAGQYIIAMDSATSTLMASVNGGAYVPFAGAFGTTVTLQQSYDAGGVVGSGTGRSITTMTGGPIVLTQNAPANDAFQISMGALSTTNGISVVSTGANAASRGIAITMNGAAATGGIVVTTGALATAAAFGATFEFRGVLGTVAGNGIVNVEVGAATTFVGPLTGIECDLRTNVNAATAQVLTNYTAKLPANMGANASVGFAYTRSGVVTATHAYTGRAVSIVNTPTGPAGGLTLTENGVLVDIQHAPIAGAGTITDTTTGLAITMTPAAANAVTGASITMAANATGAALLITHNRATAAVGTVALRITGADESVCIEMTDGDTVGLSNANEGRIIYNTTTQKFQISENGGAYVNMV